MEKVRIAHLADFHIGGELYENNELNKKINSNLIKALLEIFSVLNLAKVDVVLIAGDFYESSSLDKNLHNEIKRIFSNFSGKIVIAPGNHDYISLDSPYMEKWPDNTYIFKNQTVEYFEFKEINTRVYGFAFNKSHITTPMLSNFPEIDEKYINLGVFHGQMDETMNAYCPIFVEDIKNSNLDYIALGHIHKRSEIKKINNTYYAYSGNPVGRGFDETGKKGIYLGDISKNINGLNFYKLNNSEFHTISYNVEEFIDQCDLAEKIKNYLFNKFGEKYKKNYYRINLNGFIEKESFINIDMITHYLDEIEYIELKDNTKIKIDFDEISSENNLKGIFVQKVLNSKLKENDKEAIIDIGIRALEDLL
ncbi:MULTISPECIES: metallophosphoesterase family protein [Helcococcus]|uniref:Metallophosphoesterase n=1 Tax=Helcococcus bovis TaxID=3153252 RepID=A0ABW9F576_9FIRM